MKEFINYYDELKHLSFFLKNNVNVKNLSHLAEDKSSTTNKELKKDKKLQKDKEPTSSSEAERSSRAVKTIEHFWQQVQAKDQIRLEPYDAYNPWGDEGGDEQILLSSIMYGRHQAELKEGEVDRFKNPFIHSKAFYYRDDNISGDLLNSLLKKHHVEPKLNRTYLPIIPLHNLPIQDVIDDYFKERKQCNEDKDSENKDPKDPKEDKSSKDEDELQVISTDGCHTQILSLPQSMEKKIVPVINSLGLKASPWEVAVDLKQSKELLKNVAKKKPPHLRSEFYNHKSFMRLILRQLRSTAQDRSLPTHHLAKSVMALLTSSPELKPSARQRIADMIDLATRFYARHYTRYCFFVYGIVHELSLAIINESHNQAQVKARFDTFCAVTKEQFQKHLGLKDEELKKYSCIVVPAASGTNAYAQALQLAMRMRQIEGRVPSVRTVYPSYYEFDCITPGNNLKQEDDIYAVCLGPIVNEDGLVPGTDLNKLIHQIIPEGYKSKSHPKTIIIDTTIALYKLLKLDDYAKSLIKDGLLSLLIHQSHQKFGLIHTDQAQYGQLYALCSDKAFWKKDLERFQDNAYQDFCRHPDMQIGAYIASTVGSILEDIKKQHFHNGALLRNFLISNKLIVDQILTHPNMIVDKDELYFTACDRFIDKGVCLSLVASRDSFGHYSLTKTLVLHYQRLSPSATDDLDTLIEAARIYLSSIRLGCTMHWLDEKPLDWSSYKGDYIFLADKQELYYVNSEGQGSVVAIQPERQESLKQLLLTIKPQNSSQIYLNHEQDMKLKECTKTITIYNKSKSVCSDVFLFSKNRRELKPSKLSLEEQIITAAWLLNASGSYTLASQRLVEKIAYYLALKQAISQCSMLSGRASFSDLVNIKSKVCHQIVDKINDFDSSLSSADMDCIFQALDILYQSNSIHVTHSLYLNVCKSKETCQAIVRLHQEGVELSYDLINDLIVGAWTKDMSH